MRQFNCDFFFPDESYDGIYMRNWTHERVEGVLTRYDLYMSCFSIWHGQVSILPKTRLQQTIYSLCRKRKHLSHRDDWSGSEWNESPMCILSAGWLLSVFIDQGTQNVLDSFDCLTSLRLSVPFNSKNRIRHWVTKRWTDYELQIHLPE